MKNKRIVLLLVISACISTSVACAKQESYSQGVLLQTYSDSDFVPFDIKRIVGQKEQGEYAFFLSGYGSSEKKIGIGTLDNYNEIYQTKEGRTVPDFYVNDNYILWFEEAELNDMQMQYSLYLYNNDNKETSIIFQETFSSDSGWYATSSFGIYEDEVFWLHNNFQEEVSEIFTYDIKSGAQETLLSVPFVSDNYYNGAISCLKIHDNILVYNQRDQDGQRLLAFDIEENSIAQEVKLDNSVGTIFSADYEEKNDYFTIYYVVLDVNGEDKNEAVGGLDGQTGELQELFSLNPNRYLYRERLNIVGDCIYYDIVSDTSGDIADHYDSHIYNYKSHKATERKYTFNTMVLEDTFYFLCFEKGAKLNKTLFYEGEKVEKYFEQISCGKRLRIASMRLWMEKRIFGL